MNFASRKQDITEVKGLGLHWYEVNEIRVAA